VDGGKGQLGAALEVLREMGIEDQPIAALAKQNEELFLPGRSHPVVLPRTSQALFLVQRLRDEAHRFAITYHRNVRGKRAIVSGLDEIRGVGSARKKALVKRFGSVSELRRASAEEIAAVPGIGPKLAASIKSQLGGA
jgi:excinuclease ABC subunit C